MATPMGPKDPVTYSDFYGSLPAVVKKFVMYFFTPALYKGTFFSGVLSATLFSGMYMTNSAGSGTYNFPLTVPAPEAGAGISFVVMGAAALIFFILRDRQRPHRI